MTEITATAKVIDKDKNPTGEEREVKADFDFGTTLADAIEKFGESVVFSNFKQSVTISIQAVMRRAGADAEKTDADIQKLVSEYKPGERTAVRKTPAEKVKDLFSGKTPEEIAAILQEAGIDAGLDEAAA